MTVPAEDLSRICAPCGLCCNGTIFAFVELHDHELPTAERHHLPLVQPVVPGHAHFSLPCPRHVDGVGCSIYDDRPGACRKYVCKLLQDASSGGTPVDRQIKKARRARELRDKLEGRGVELRNVTREGTERARAGIAVDPAGAELMLDLVELRVTLKKDYAALDD